MKAPEKLYFDGKTSACKQPIFSSYNIEYIRKDALMEWINGMKEKHKGFTDTELVVTLDKLIDKLNEM